jgi:hypothetical protein
MEKAINPSLDLVVDFKGKSVMVHELTMENIYSIFGRMSDLQSMNKATFQAAVDAVLPMVFTNLTSDDLFCAKPSEIKRLWVIVQEVNAVFFAISDYLGISKLKDNLLAALQSDFNQAIKRRLSQIAPTLESSSLKM